MGIPTPSEINAEIDSYKDPVQCYAIIMKCQYRWGEDFFDQVCNFYFDQWLNDFYDYLLDINEIDIDIKNFFQKPRKYHTPQFVDVYDFMTDLVPMVHELIDKAEDFLMIKVYQLFADFICQTDERRTALYNAVYYPWDEYLDYEWDDTEYDYSEFEKEYNALKAQPMAETIYKIIGGKENCESNN